ncbi:MAG: secondary thiamine-phosphate synthase enzyme YjbQ, partial [Patescibacteria group bacterium]
NKILTLAPEGEDYQHNHIDNNARAHVIASILGTSLTLIIEEGHLVRGKWQNIFFVELDGPRVNREVMVKIFGEK